MIKPTNKSMDRLLEEWHNSDSSLPVHEYLGITLEQYAYWVETNELKLVEQK